MQLANLSWPAVRALSKDTPIIFPIAALEQHGGHLPLFTDSLLLGEIVRRAAERLGDCVVWAPQTWLGNSDHHLDFAGTLSAARVLVLGAGVAGLQAIATARRLGAIVSAFDVRPAVKEQVQSLGAIFLELAIAEHAETAGGYAKELSEETHRRELAFLADAVKDADIVITTAAIPGKKAPVLVTAAAVQGMKPGSVIVDLAAETGGNCELTQPGADIVRAGVAILGPLNLPSTVPLHASQMYAKNVSAFLGHIVQEGKLRLDFEDQIIRETCVTYAGEVRRS
jgi:NAD(P) transhydrogenase subunit alpha